ncbi:phage major capsid protein [Stutzerimonas decontaminans]|uniref:HK97 family phage major capsid protein n=1 Tax=Stutzerimonas stutzeri TaxID=316 RepID=A0A023WVI6_STUST|nr:phage major capsid protein [Stutzerimonas decontaminans]AHY43829.1 HK97 family phage major capsid protein [Stutzerimonas decontaminans]
MSKVLQLRSERAQLNTELQALAKLEADGTSLNAEQLAKFGELEAQINTLSDKISRAESAERAAASSAVPVNEGAQGITSPPGSRVEGPYNQPTKPDVAMAQMVRLLVQAQGNQQQAAELAKANGFGADVHMALSTVTPGAGGTLVPENFSSGVIESLRPKSVVRRMGAVSLPLNNGNMTLPRINGNTSVSYIGTEQDIPLTEMTFADLKLSAKKAAAIVPISNDLLAFSGVNPRVDALVSSDLATSMGLSEDLHFIRGPGVDPLPKGLRYWAPAGHIVAQPAGVTLADVDTFLGGLMLRLEVANVDLAACGWIMHPRTIRWLQSLRDGNGNKAYPEIDAGLLKGYKWALTTQIPTNLGAGGNESEIYFVNFADCYIGEVEQLAIAISTEASYKDGEGNVVSAFQRDQTLIRVVSKHDFGPRHVESIAIGTGVTWGAGM